MEIVFPPNARQIINEIRDAIGRTITIYIPVSGIPCTYSGDALDPITGLSTNQFCPVCGGNYWLSTISGLDVLAHITYPGIDTPYRVPGGNIFDGDVQIQIEATDETTYAISIADYYEIDGIDYIKKSVSPRGVKDINRYVIKLVERK